MSWLMKPIRAFNDLTPWQSAKTETRIGHYEDDESEADHHLDFQTYTEIDNYAAQNGEGPDMLHRLRMFRLDMEGHLKGQGGKLVALFRRDNLIFAVWWIAPRFTRLKRYTIRSARGSGQSAHEKEVDEEGIGFTKVYEDGFESDSDIASDAL